MRNWILAIAVALMAISPAVQAQMTLEQIQQQTDVNLKLRSLDAGLKAAQEKKDTAAVLAWSKETSKTTRAIITSEKPANMEEAVQWRSQIDLAKQVDATAEYALYSLAFETTDTASLIEVATVFQDLYPKSEYYGPVGTQLYTAYQKSGNAARAAEVAQSVLEVDKENETMLLAVAQYNLDRGRSKDAASYASRLVSVMNSKAKPEGMTDGDWSARKNQFLGLGRLITGVAQSNLGQFGNANNTLQQAVPLVKSNAQALALAYFHLGVSNYKAQNIPAAYKYFQQCSAIPGPLRAQADQNIAAIGREYRMVR